MTDVSDANRFAPPRAAVADLRPVVDGPQLADRGERLFAAIIDSLLMMAIALPIFFGFMDGMTLYGAEEMPSTWSLLVGMLPGYAIVFAIQGWFLHTSGQTVGKKARKLRIVRTDGSRAGVGRLLFLRLGLVAALTFIPFVGRLIGLVDSLLIFRASRKCLHDQIADTLVVTAASSQHATLAAVRAAASGSALPA